MSNGEDRPVSLHDLQLVQNLIECCLQLYMSQAEVVDILFQQAKIEPDFTDLVWHKLEAQNQEFFRAYYQRLIVKDQIIRFNQLLERQAELMHHMSHYGDVSNTVSNGLQTHSMHYNAAYQDLKPTTESIKADNMHQVINDIPNVYTIDTSSVPQCMQPGVVMGGLGGWLDVHGNMPLAQSTNAGIMQGFNLGMMKTVVDQSSDSLVMFGPGNNLLQPHHVIGEAPISSFSGGESSSLTLNDAMFETNSIGPLEQMTRNFSLSDLTADFFNGAADIVERYSKSPFLGTEADARDFQKSGEDQAEISWLDSILDDLNYKDLGSEWP